MWEGYGSCQVPHSRDMMIAEFGMGENFILARPEYEDMEEIDGSELPARKAEFLKTVYQMGGVVRTNDLAADLGVSPSTTTKAAAALTTAGYLEHTPYRGVTLTEKGEEYARFLVRRHRIVSLALSRFGLSSEEACLEARKIEACVSRELVDRICASLGHPMMSGCGPIEHGRSCCPDEP